MVRTVLCVQSRIYHPYRSIDNIIDVGKVAYHVAMVEHLDRLSFGYGIGKQHWRHIGASPRTVNGEIPKSRYTEPVQFAIRMSHQFVRLLTGGVHAHWRVYLVVLMIWHMLV